MPYPDNMNWDAYDEYWGKDYSPDLNDLLIDAERALYALSRACLVSDYAKVLDRSPVARRSLSDAFYYYDIDEADVWSNLCVDAHNLCAADKWYDAMKIYNDLHGAVQDYRETLDD